MRIKYRDGSSRSGLIVSLKGGVMRVALADCEDLLEFKLVDDTWISDECEMVSFEFTPGISQHENFRMLVVEAVKPMERLDGYLAAGLSINGTVN